MISVRVFHVLLLGPLTKNVVIFLSVLSPHIFLFSSFAFFPRLIEIMKGHVTLWPLKHFHIVLSIT